MKRVATVFFVMAASLLLSATAILGAENNPPTFGEYWGGMQSSHVKNECLLVAKNCVSDSSTVQQRVHDLRREIAKGQFVYTPNELDILKEQLKWLESESGNEVI